MKTIAIANQKGGVGKTTTTANLGIGLAQAGRKVLLIDFDAQGSLTASLGYVPDELETTIANLMEKTMNERKIMPYEGILHHAEGVDLIPANIELSGMEVTLVNTMSRELILKDYLHNVKKDYDYILIDCPPSLGIVTTNAFIAADEIIVPMTPELLPLKGMRMLDAFVTTLQRVKPSLRLGGVFIARFNHRKLNKVVEQAVKERYESITMNTRIRENIALAESAGSGKSIFEYDLNSNGAKDYLALTEEILSRNQ